MALWDLYTNEKTSPSHNELDDQNPTSSHHPEASTHPPINIPHSHPHEYVLVPYISTAVVPLIDYWPPLIRDAFAKGVWGLVYINTENVENGTE